MHIQVKYFAILRERTGIKAETVELTHGALVEDLFNALSQKHPTIGELRSSLRAAVNQTFVGFDAPLQDHDEVVFIPPVSGGDGRIRLTENPLDIKTLRELVISPTHGAIVTFEGTVRDHRDGNAVLTLEYETYFDMALKKLAEVASRVEDQFGVQVAIHHRFGLMQVGATAVVIAVGAAHRAEAFDACRAVIEALKVEVPIWKKETGPDGSVWVGVGP